MPQMRVQVPQPILPKSSYFLDFPVAPDPVLASLATYAQNCSPQVMPTPNTRGGITGGRQGQDTHGSAPRRRESDSPRQHLLLARTRPHAPRAMPTRQPAFTEPSLFRP